MILKWNLIDYQLCGRDDLTLLAGERGWVLPFPVDTWAFAKLELACTLGSFHSVTRALEGSIIFRDERLKALLPRAQPSRHNGEKIDFR
jgi:hypothetical protein